LAATIAMLLGLSFVSYSALNVLVWVSSIAALTWLARLYGFALARGALSRGLLLLRRELRGIRATVLLSLADFIIIVFPYYLLVAVKDATAVVAFDMFYKVTRFAVLSYLIGAETALPHQTRAAHDGDAERLVRATAKNFLVGLLPMISGIFAIAIFGERLFGVILNHDGVVSPVMRLAICAMLVFTLVQTTCQIVLVGVGKFEELARRACITLACMVLMSTLMVTFQWSSDTFIIAYVTIYGAGSLLYAESFHSFVRAMRSECTYGGSRQLGTKAAVANNRTHSAQ
jgi:O-antigen/teichoic acid export membrane protein